jgi:Josephin
MASIKTNIVDFTNAPGDYTEVQKNHLCAKHAINHVLQEEKIVWNPTQSGPRGYLISDIYGPARPHILDKTTKINLFEACTQFPAYQASLGNMKIRNYKATGYNINEEGLLLPVNDDENPVLCNFSSGETPFQLVYKILGDLKYNIKEAYNIKELGDRLTDENLLGVVINLGGWHFTAISKFVKQCKSWERNMGTKRLTSVSYAYMESLGPRRSPSEPIITCMNKTDLLTFINTLRPQGFIFVYDQPGAYKSVAMLRLGQLLTLKRDQGYALQGGRSTKRNRRRARRSTRRN